MLTRQVDVLIQMSNFCIQCTKMYLEPTIESNLLIHKAKLISVQLIKMKTFFYL